MSSRPVHTFDSLALTSDLAAGTTATIFLRATARAACCPLCNQPSTSIHSRYSRKLADLPRQGQALHLWVQVRRFRCPAAHCPRRIFAERLPFAAAFARTTRRLHDTHAQIGLFLGGEAGARLSSHLAMPTSPDTLLRRIRRLPVPPAPPVRILGVDDWALRRGQRYGTILVDLERRRPIDLLPQRSAEALAQWLRAHPEVQVITRDRADDYIKGTTQGAPQAVQVADRWHLLRNLRDALRRVVDRLRSKIQQTLEATHPVPSSPETEALAGDSRAREEPTEEPQPTRYRQRQLERRQRRLELYQQIRDLHQYGVSHREIGRRLRLNRATVRRFARAESFPERAFRRTPRRTDPVVAYLWERWNAGCRNAVRLFEELQARGFEGSYYMVRRRLAGWRRQAQSGRPDKASKASPGHYISPRRIVWLLSQPDAELDSDERALCDRLEQCDRGLASAAALGREFRAMVRGRHADRWGAWIKKARAPGTPADLQTFAQGLQADEGAVRAALTSEWSNGQVEGQVNRLKLIKRQMFGRAKFDLLRKRFLVAA